MAEKEKEKDGKKDHGKKPKHKLKSIHTHVAEDGSFVHEHHYEDERGHAMAPRFGGVSENMDDLHQHMDDHLGPQEDDDPAQQPDGDGAQPGAGAGAQPEAE